MPNFESPPAAHILTDEGPYILSNKSYKDVCIFVVVLDDTEGVYPKISIPKSFQQNYSMLYCAGETGEVVV
jgi:hypothetical protein